MVKRARPGRTTKRVKRVKKSPQRPAMRDRRAPAMEEEALDEQKFSYQKTFNLKDEDV